MATAAYKQGETLINERVISTRQDEIVLTNASSYWLIEIVKDIGSRSVLTKGIVSNSKVLRLKHLVTSKYLSVNETGGVCLEEGQTESNLFELRLNFDHNSPVFRDFLESATIPAGANVRIFHVQSKSYLILARDLRTNDMAFTLSKSSYDKDVYQAIAIEPGLVDIVQTGKKLYHGVESFVRALQQSASQPLPITKKIMSAANLLVKSLSHEGGYLNRERSDYNEIEMNLSYNVCFELGMVSSLFQLAQSGFQRIFKTPKHQEVHLHPEEESLISDAYISLRMLLRKSKETKRPDIPRDVVSLMVRHLTMMGRLGTIGNNLCSFLPLTEVIDAIHEDMMAITASNKSSNEQGNSSSSSGGGSNDDNIMTPSDVEALLDFVEKMVRSNNVIPDPLPWKLLARVCNPLQAGSTNGNGEGLVNKKMQLEVCRQLLGSPFDSTLQQERHPGWSMFMYRTSLEPRKEAMGAISKPQLLICTSPAGQIRPYVHEGHHYSPVRPESLPMEECSEDIWQGAITFRNGILKSSDRICDAVFNRLDEVNNAALEQQYTNHLSNLFLAIKWKSINDLSFKECELLQAMINLLASLCVGKNVWTQRVVRQLLPVDHLLVLLDAIKISSDSNMDKIVFLLPLKTAALHFLHECYIDSAFITPIPASGKEGMKEVDFSRVNNCLTWDESLLHECSTKVFSLFSQLDCFFQLDLAADMSENDLELYMRNLDNFCEIELSILPLGAVDTEEGGSHIEKLAFHLNQVRHDFPSLNKAQKLKHLKSLQELYKSDLVRLCEYAVFQRQQLKELVEHFVKFEAAILWESKIQTPILQLSCADKTIFGRSDMSMSVRVEESRHIDDIKEINLCVGYFNGMLRILRSLLLRQFFDPDYNKSVIFTPIMAAPGGDTTRMSLSNIRSPKHNHHRLSMSQSSHSMGGAGGKSRNSHDTTADGLKPEQGHDSQENNSSIGKLNVLRELAATFMKMLGSWPGNYHALAIDLSDDERVVEEYFKRLFGEVKDALGLVEGVVGIKLQCCNLLSVCLDILHVSTTRELRRIFDFLLECLVRHRKKAPNSDDHGAMVQERKKGGRSNNATGGDKAKGLLLKQLKQYRKYDLSKEEILTFRHDVRAAWHVRVIRSPDMIWNETLLFQQETFQTLLKMVMYNNPQLRAEVLHLIYRINSHQSELATYMSNDFKQAIADDTPVVHYIKQQTMSLITVLTRFDRFFELSSSSSSSPSTHDKKQQHNQLVKHQPQVEITRREERLHGFLLHMRKILLSSDGESTLLGLITFIFRMDKYPVDTTEPLEEQDIEGDKLLTATQKKGKMMKLAAKKAHARNNKVRSSQIFAPTAQELFITANKEVDMQVPCDKIFAHAPNFDHQNALIECGLHTLIISFLVNNGNQASVTMQQYSETLHDPCVEVFRFCIVFLRAIVFQREGLIEKVVTEQLLSLLISLRHLVQEALDFIIEILQLHPNIAEKISFGDFCTLVEDIRAVVCDLEAGPKHTVAYFNATQMNKIVHLTLEIITAEVSNSRERLNHIVSCLLDKEMTATGSKFKVQLLHRILLLGMQYRLRVGATVTGGPLMIDFDVQQTCYLYQVDTNRISFSRMPKDVLADPVLSDEMYGRFKQAMSKWKLLPNTAPFKLHLELIGALGFFSRHSTDLHTYLHQKLFPSMKEVLQILLIDKYEIRIGYLQFLHGVWFYRLRDSLTMTTISKSMFDQETIMYLRALFYSFTQDLRFFMMVANDTVARTTTNLSDLGNFPQHIRLLSRYLFTAVIPFLFKVIKMNLIPLLDILAVIPIEPVVSSNGTQVPFPTFQSLLNTIVDLIAEITLRDPSSMVHGQGDLLTLEAILHSNNSTDNSSMSHQLVQSAENYVASVEKAVNKSHHEAHNQSERDKNEEWVQALRVKCLSHFILEVDLLAKTNGYTNLTHLLKIGNAYHIYVNERELDIPPLANAADVDFVSQALHVPPLDIIRTPMNAATFRYTVKEISKMILAYSLMQYPLDCANVMEKVSDLRYSVEQNLLPEFNNIPSPTTVANASGDAIQHKFAYHYEKWIKRGGVILEKLIEHMKYTLDCLKNNRGLENTTASMDDLCHSNAYWCNVFTRGLLRDRSDDIAERYSEQTELLLALNEIEGDRLTIMQHVFADLGSVDLIVTQFSATQMRLHVHTRSIQLLQSMAMGFGTAVNTGGNLRIQRSLVEQITSEVQHAVTAGNGVHFLKVARNKLRDYSRIFFTGKESKKSRTFTELQRAADDVVELLRFFSLLCEGHNRVAQEYLGTNNLVSDIATFISDLGKVLGSELNEAMITEYDVPFKHHPTLLGKRRAMVKWVDPVPNRPPSESESMSSKLPTQQSQLSMNLSPGKEKKIKYKFLDLDRISLLAKLMTSGLEALSEFCQGPRAAIQLIVARGGATKDFATFFQFFGALHLSVEYNGAIFRNEYQRRDFTMLYHEQVGYIARYQALLQYPTEKLYWHGNDPLGSALFQSIIFDQGNDSSNATSNKLPLRATLNLKQRDSTTQRIKRLSSLITLDAMIHDSHDDDNKHGQEKILNDIQGWSDEKYRYLQYRKSKDKDSDNNDGVENNFYSRIAIFEETMVHFEQSCLKFAMSLLEGSTTAEENMEISRIVVQDIGTANLVCNMANYWDRFLHYTPVKNASYSSTAAAAGVLAMDHDCYERDMSYSYYGLVMRIFDTRMDGIDELKELRDKWLDEYRIPVNEHIARIEVRYEHEKDLAVTYFPIPRIIKSYWNRGDILELREHILFPSSVGSRDSADEKVKNFLKDGRFLLDTLRHLESLDENYAGMSIIHWIVINLAHNLNRWSNISTILSITINFLLLLSVTSSPTDGYIISTPLYHELIDDVGIALVCSAGLSFCSYLVLYGSLYVKLGLKNNPENAFAVNNFAVSRVLGTLNKIGLLGREPAVITSGGAIKFKTWTITAALFHFFSRPDSWYYIVLLSFALVGYTTLKPTYAICMMEVLRVSKLMQYVSKAFTANIDQVIATVILAAIIMYLFVTFAYSSPVIHNQYNLDGQGEDGCFSLQECFRLHLDFGLLNTVGWNYPVHIPTAIGELYNFLFVFILQIVIPGLISGIIIDTFSEMRGNKQALEDDVFGNCFICNISRDDFEAAGVSFEEHIKNDHNMWKYLWFIIYLDEKNHTEYDGIEQFCAEQPKESTRWLPIRKARALSNMRERYDLFTLYTKITLLQGQLDRLHTGFKADLNTQEKTIREIVKSENQDVERMLKHLTSELHEVRRGVEGGGEDELAAGGSLADMDGNSASFALL